MKFHHKALVWVREVVHFFTKKFVFYIHKNPPHHYLGYVRTEKVPVVLIPGISNKWAQLKPLGDKISLLGHPVYILPELGYNFFSIPDSAKILRNLIEKENLSNTVIVAHSKGGLIGKYYLMHENKDARVLGVVAIATPFSGSKLATTFLHASFEELKVGSGILLQLDIDIVVNKKIISIYPAYDTHIKAKEGSYLKNASKNIEIQTGGHNLIISNKQASRAVLDSIEEIASYNA